RLQALRDNLVQAKSTFWADQVEVQRRAAAAMLARARGNNQEALAMMRSAADLEGSMEKHPVTPAPVVPTRELLAQLLLDLNQFQSASHEFEAVLTSEPNRFHSLYGAGRAAALAGDTNKAKVFYAKLVKLCEH